ncbi:MAG: superoxide dismutase [Alphaproteobacteria bacterium]|nr:superoxide dismutase [Alphaproteobacteria bacterium]MCV6599553.1 superoxide dismutase [Alphaproteobacteria bacterium]
MKFELPELKFLPEDISDFMSEDTIFYHYEKHHRAYANKANEAVKNTPYEALDIDLILKDTYRKNSFIFNNVAQFYNHNLFWEIIGNSKDKSPSKEFKEKISKKFGSFEKFKDEFCALAASQFGSGWCWLVQEKDGALEIYKTSNAKNPLIYDQNPLMCCDVWEHAYYLDYQNDRLKYIKRFLDNVVDWKQVEKRMK